MILIPNRFRPKEPDFLLQSNLAYTYYEDRHTIVLPIE